MIAIEASFFGKQVTLQTSCAVALVCFGVALATITDSEVGCLSIDAMAKDDWQLAVTAAWTCRDLYLTISYGTPEHPQAMQLHDVLKALSEDELASKRLCGAFAGCCDIDEQYHWCRLNHICSYLPDPGQP